MTRRRLNLLAGVLIQLVLSPAALLASRVDYIFEGQITGTFTGGEATFVDQPFVLNLTADTDSIRHIGDGIFEIEVVGDIHVQGQPDARILEFLHLWSDFGPTSIYGEPLPVPSIGLSVDAFDSGAEVLNQPSTAFEGFALDRPLGPVALPTFNAITGIPQTQIGTLDSFQTRDVTFRALVSDSPPVATAIPLPLPLWAGAALLASSFAAISPRRPTPGASPRTSALRCSAAR